LDITDAEGFELLSTSERNLCSILRLLPKLYLSIKETLIAAHQKYGYLKRAQARGLIKIDVNKTSRIYDFFVTAGWIKPHPQARDTGPATRSPQDEDGDDKKMLSVKLNFGLLKDSSPTSDSESKGK
jgi:SWIRM domain